MRLRPSKVEKIKAAIASGMKQSEIAKKYKTSRSNVSDIATGRVHKDVAWPDGEPPTPKSPGGQHKPVPGYDPTDQKIMELEAEVVHLTEERNRRAPEGQGQRQERRLVQGDRRRNGAAGEALFGASSVLDFRRKAQIVEHCVMHLSDGHHDQVVRPEEVGGLEDYSFPVSCAAPNGTWTP